MKNGISKLVEELEEAQETVKEQHARVVELRRQLAEELGLHPGAPAAAVALVEKAETNGVTTPTRKHWVGERTRKILHVLAQGRRKQTSAEIADAIGCPRPSIGYYLTQLVDKRKIQRIKRGVYSRAN